MRLVNALGLAFLLVLVTGGQLAQANDARETRVGWLERCPHEPDPTVDEVNRSALIGGLIAAIAPKLIEGTVDAAAEALKAAGQAKTSTTTARNGASFYKVGQDADLIVASTCLAVVRGTFKQGAASAAEFGWANPSTPFHGLQHANLQFEAKVVPIKGAKFFRLVPQYLRHNGDFEDTGWFAGKQRDFLLAMAMSLPGSAQPFGQADFLFHDVVQGSELVAPNALLTAATSLPIAFPAETSDATKAKTQLEATLSPWLLAMDILMPAVKKAVPPPPSLFEGTTLAAATARYCTEIRRLNAQTPEKFQLGDTRCTYELDVPRASMESTSAQANRSPLRVDWAQQLCGSFTPAAGTAAPICSRFANDPNVQAARTLVTGKLFTHVTTQLTLSETREGSKLAQFFGNALSAAKTEVSTVLKDKLLPKTSEQKATEAEAERAAANGVLLADLKVTQAEEELAEALAAASPVASDITAARIDLLKSKIESNKARRDAHMPVLYSEVQ
ncbi:hypothetical protein [Hydrogenophaga sp.]|uniref:hypothetical protein n=1 Tax=Hydrogenophaga sp. TaxID=1904254 RepID=UPI00260E6D22|nr:hypothetical protein [Hydrogenophaga sp.]MDM7950370.1 hypothetical protein [Hydrogenophaga sp.]